MNNVVSMGSANRSTVTETFDRYVINGIEVRKLGKRCACAHYESAHTDDEQVTCAVCSAERRDDDFRCTGFTEQSDLIPDPGTVEAILFGCTCPVDRNVAALAHQQPAIYDGRCPVHLWVCQAAVCAHAEGDEAGGERTFSIEHIGPHEFCDHCTSPFVVCERCQAMYFDWRVDPRTRGWKVTNTNADPNSVIEVFGSGAGQDGEWTCGNCS